MARTGRLLLAAPLLASALGAGCVTTSSHEQALADQDRLHQEEMAKAQAQDEADKARAADLEKKLAEETRREAELRKQLEGTSGQLDELGRQKAAADARAATYKALTDRLRSMIDAGKLSVKIRKGRMLISLPTDVLFASGSAELKKAGQDAVAQVAQALSGLSDRQFLVAGHTDDKPIHTARFPSNWELSTERAVVVTRFLVGKGLKPQALGAVGYGEFDPLVDNDTDEHRAQNRRIEIQLQPNLSELPPTGEQSAQAR